MAFLAGLLILYNALMLIVFELVAGHALRTLLPTSMTERLEAYRSAMSSKERWVRIGLVVFLYIGGNSILVVILVKALLAARV